MKPSLAAQSQLVLDPIVPIGAVIVLGVIVVAMHLAIHGRVSASLDAPRRWLLLSLRLCAVVLVVTLLLQPSRREEVPPISQPRILLAGIDDSRSMAQGDVDQTTRSQAARALLIESGLTAPDGNVADTRHRLFKFAEDAAPLANTTALTADGSTTRFHRSISTMLASLGAHEAGHALVLLSDGHDFELTNAARTGLLARQRQTPIYAVALGQTGQVRDVSARITSYQPYTYVRQKARIAAALRLIGCEHEMLQVELLRSGLVVQQQRLPSRDEPELTVAFEVSEATVGQFEYAIRVQPVSGEKNTENNQALTFLNVVDQQIQVLFIEGAPYWDTTFLQRSLMRNDKMNVDSLVQYAPGKARLIRKQPGSSELRLPTTVDDWKRYDVIVLGRQIDETLLSRPALQALQDFVQNHGGTVIFSRGPAFSGALAGNELEPVLWSRIPQERLRLQVAREGQNAAPLRTLQERTKADEVPEVIAGFAAGEKRPLTATLAATNPAGAEPLAGLVHRRVGEGQVLSIGVEGLWRWAFNARIDSANTLFDRFWDQMILWLLAGRDFLPTQQFALRASSANVPLGEKIFFRAQQRETGNMLRDLPLVVTQDGREVSRVTLGPADSAHAGRLNGEFVPARTGLYEATARFPDGQAQSVRFIVYDDNLEQIEVATDPGYLRRLCESSGGRLLAPAELARLLAELRDQVQPGARETRLVSVWDRDWVFWVIGLTFAADWYLRRRWGLS